MTTQLLATELANLIQESKRKHNDLRQVCDPRSYRSPQLANFDLKAAEKSLDELKELGNVSEKAAADREVSRPPKKILLPFQRRQRTSNQAGLELSKRPRFVDPFVIACGTKNVKFTGIAIVCLQRLVAARALPPTQLDPILEALMQATSAGLDVQLKILQLLPPLLQNYASELKGELLLTVLNICLALQGNKNAIVNNTSAATLQQLVLSVFDKVVTEDGMCIVAASKARFLLLT